MPRENRSLIVPAVACAAACVILMRTGLLSLFFLVPLGFSAAAFGAPVAWLAFMLATLGNMAWFALARGGQAGFGFDLLYFAVFALGFTWVMAGNPPAASLLKAHAQGDTASPIPHVRTLFRFVGAAFAATAMFLLTFHRLGQDGFAALVPMVEALVPADVGALAGGDAVAQTFMEHAFTAERIVEAVVAVAFRGGALFSAVALLFFSRQLAFLLARLFRRGRAGAGDLAGFFAPRRAIWVFSLSLLAVVLGATLSMQAVEIAAWNLLVMCGLMFLAQGGGIVLFGLSRRPMPAPARVLLCALFVIVAFSPGVNLFALGALLILGIAENWLPLRAAKKSAPPPS